jgi:8-hydroxy-5-deazaflavin:NADPH oxidoreductase
MVETSTDQPVRTVGIVGGTGKLGMALAARFANAGLSVVIGSRVAAKGIDAATALGQRLPRSAAVIVGADNATACAVDGVVIIAVPYEGLDDIIAELAESIGDRVVISTVVPVRFVKGDGPSPIDVPAGSACEQIAAQLPAARVVGALQTLSFATLRELDRPVDSDVILTGDDDSAKVLVAQLLAALGSLRVIDGGHLRNSRFVEQLTVLLLSINARYRRHAGVRITDISDPLAATWSRPTA